MLPHTKADKLNKTIYINPNFKGQLRTPENTSLSGSDIPKNAHINPLFLAVHKFRSTIHMNPAFLQKLNNNQIQPQRKILENALENSSIRQADNIAINLSSEKSTCLETRKIICKSKNRLIREPIRKNDSQLAKPSFPLQPLIVLNKRKLIRKSCFVPETCNKLERVGSNDTQNRITRYKLDNRTTRKNPILPPTPRIKRTSFVGQYALKRSSSSETSNTFNNKRFILTSKNKKLQVLNINGLLYKSTRNSLKLKDIKTERELKLSNSIISAEKPSPNTNQGLTIFVRGTKYVMDQNKFKLTRIANCDHGSPDRMTNKNSLKDALCKRIDIGGYTYVSSNSAKNVLIRTTNHLSRAYVHNAKQKSLQTMRRLVKTNIPCPIFQRIGKCAAFERGKCSKVHNKLQVVICSKFLRGECLNSSCLLSHNVSLSKMPACKFFLQGVCVRNDCPYLHKKLSNTAQLCTDFLRGFCQMADKCDKRHEFVCPEIERNNICTAKNCIHCNEKKRKEAQIATKLGKTEYAENQNCKRYFFDSSDVAKENASKGSENCSNAENEIITDITECCEENTEKSFKTRPKLGFLPSYIPL